MYPPALPRSAVDDARSEVRNLVSAAYTTTLRPRRTTEPLPTSENPLLRFYPQERERKPDNEDEMMSDEGGKGGRTRRKPMTELFSNASSKLSGQSLLVTLSISGLFHFASNFGVLAGR